MKKISKIPQLIITLSFHLAVWLIEHFSNIERYQKKVDKLQELEKGTLGKDIAECLSKNKLRLVPGYESHDLKHVLLDYKMNPVDEIRMQAFMIGNGNVSILSLAIFLYGFLLLPNKWRTFYKDFKSGLASQPIKHWQIDQYAKYCTADLRKRVIGTEDIQVVMQVKMKKLSLIASCLSMILGVVGMLYCLPFLFSPVLEDLVGAGFPFVGGAVLFAAGLISFSINNRKAGPNKDFMPAGVYSKVA
ncbi:hypothetical protein [Pontibacter ramchanderi]|uniref:Uncharacterized protein n=1 Tax=Pontibacter ramchanderi TaxID=1179743 RepID=A0A2N3V481_9BACT|nr:hypothetical protein [Pontibacter ramchanderi]PKV76418.1 hypothetical protein BD749_1371 [Pontibacter ramchanderi]